MRHHRGTASPARGLSARLYSPAVQRRRSPLASALGDDPSYVRFGADLVRGVTDADGVRRRSRRGSRGWATSPRRGPFKSGQGWSWSPATRPSPNVCRWPQVTGDSVCKSAGKRVWEVVTYDSCRKLAHRVWRPTEGFGSLQPWPHRWTVHSVATTSANLVIHKPT